MIHQGARWLLAGGDAIAARVDVQVAAFRRRQEERGAELVAWARDPARGWPSRG